VVKYGWRRGNSQDKPPETRAYAYNVGIVAEVLGTFEQAVLLEVLRLDEDAYGRAILRGLHARLEREVTAGAVHATLERLEGKGLLASRLGPGTAVRAGRARRFYRIQPAGLRALNDARRTYTNIWRGLKWPVTTRGMA
jgi:PadR family transcriptional regulator